MFGTLVDFIEKSGTEHFKLLIDGKWVDPTTSKTLDVINPATEEVCGKIALGSAAGLSVQSYIQSSTLGAFSAADAMFAPVVNRFHVYELTRNPGSLAYMDAVKTHPAFAKWQEAALKESLTALQQKLQGKVKGPIVAHCHEWLAGFTLLYLRAEEERQARARREAEELAARERLERERAEQLALFG